MIDTLIAFVLGLVVGAVECIVLVVLFVAEEDDRHDRP